MSLVIPPSIGRRVLVFTAGTTGVLSPSVPFDGGIAYVHSADSPAGQSMINVGARDHNGKPLVLTSVPLLDRAVQTTDVHGKGENYAVWMEYQFEQAQRAAQAKAEERT